MQVCLKGFAAIMPAYTAYIVPHNQLLLVQGQATDDDLSNTDLMDEMSRLQDNSDGAQLQMEREEVAQAGHSFVSVNCRSQRPQAASVPFWECLSAIPIKHAMQTKRSWPWGKRISMLFQGIPNSESMRSVAAWKQLGVRTPGPG